MTPHQHLGLLLRFDRTFNLRQAIIEGVREGDSVMDAGCGLGILSQWAVSAGAKNVDAVDLSDLTLARKIAEDNGSLARVSFHQTNLFDFVEADPSRKSSYDVLIAMVYFNDPRRDETQTKLKRELKKKLLSPNGRLIPDRVEYTIVICDWPEFDWSSIQLRLHDQVREVSDRYDLELSSLWQHLSTHPINEYFPPRDRHGRIDLTSARLLSKETDAFAIDYLKDQCDYPPSVSAKLNQDGHPNVVVWWQRIIANNQLVFTNQSISWTSNSRFLEAGSEINLSLDDRWRQTNVMTISH